jgi:hypothetical protein
MHVCAKCSQPFSGSSCASCGAPVRPTRSELRKINKKFNTAIIVSLVGLFGMLVTCHFYRPVDSGPVMFTGLAVFFAPVIVQMVLNGFHRLQIHVELVKKLYQTAALTLTLLTILLIANGALDRQPAQQVEVTVAARHISSGRSTSYTLYLAPSWRAGHSMERLNVSRDTYFSVRTGAPAHLTVHRGVFGLSWYSDIYPG